MDRSRAGDIARVSDHCPTLSDERERSCQSWRKSMNIQRMQVFVHAWQHPRAENVQKPGRFANITTSARFVVRAGYFFVIHVLWDDIELRFAFFYFLINFHEFRKIYMKFPLLYVTCQCGLPTNVSKISLFSTKS